MTSDEILKTLECCFRLHPICPTFCPMLKTPNCGRELRKKAFYLINNLKAENERLEEEKEQLKADIEMFTDIGKMYSELKADAIKEFAERLKKELSFGHYIQPDQIDNLVKEMVGDNNVS